MESIYYLQNYNDNDHIVFMTNGHFVKKLQYVPHITWSWLVVTSASKVSQTENKSCMPTCCLDKLFRSLLYKILQFNFLFFKQKKMNFICFGNKNHRIPKMYLLFGNLFQMHKIVISDVFLL